MECLYTSGDRTSTANKLTDGLEVVVSVWPLRSPDVTDIWNYMKPLVHTDKIKKRDE
jgi:hypothetical protein